LARYSSPKSQKASLPIGLASAGLPVGLEFDGPKDLTGTCSVSESQSNAPSGGLPLPMQREGCYFEAYRLTDNRNPSSYSPEPMASAPAKAG
jgi:hypothetical protein